MSVSNFDQESMNSSSSKEREVWEFGSGELFNLTNHSSKRLKQLKEGFLNLDDYINANYNSKSLRSCLVSQPKTNKNQTNFISSTQEDLVPITFNKLIPEDEIFKNNLKNISVLPSDIGSTSRYAKILIDSGASALIIHGRLYAQINLIQE